MGQNHRRSGGLRPPAGSGGGVLQKLENFFKVGLVRPTSKFYAFLVVFSPVYAYVFFRACRRHSTKSAKWGI